MQFETKVTKEVIGDRVIYTNWYWSPTSNAWIRYTPPPPAFELEPQNDRATLPRNW